MHPHVVIKLFKLVVTKTTHYYTLHFEVLTYTIPYDGLAQQRLHMV